MIYLDNAATTLYKPHSVRRACNACLKKFCANSGRGGHKAALMASERIYACRESLAELFGISDPARIVFTPNATAALNIAIKGILTPDSHTVITGMEHNSVVRPVVGSGAYYSVALPDETGLVSAKSIENLITDNTKLIIAIHASNITGTINPIYEIGEVAKKYGIPFLVDAAQSAGVAPIDAERNNISMLAFPGHKMLYGPTGTGGLYISPGLELKPFIEGGTGSLSESDTQPDFLPDRFESGTLNTLGITGLYEGVKFVLKHTPSALYAHEARLAKMLVSGLSSINGVRIYGNNNRVGVVGFRLEGKDSVDVANTLDSRFDIACRGGLHCAFLAHKSMGTSEGGLVRMSVSYFTTENEIDRAVEAVKKIQI
ncbi:MAG: putative cysteine desulfurase [Firmicutes bacterium ADurb.Bin193]|nr:MAG: putative cysteine desulfurase [Firmicutes bacterium ADurb.Bin193]